MLDIKNFEESEKYETVIKATVNLYQDENPEFVNAFHEIDESLINQEIKNRLDDFKSTLKEKGFEFDSSFQSVSCSFEKIENGKNLTVELSLDELPKKLLSDLRKDNREKMLEDFESAVKETFLERLDSIFEKSAFNIEEIETSPEYLEYADFVSSIIKNRKEKFSEAFEEKSFDLEEYNDGKNESYFEINGYLDSFSNKNIVESFYAESDLSNFNEEFSELVDNYDPEEEAEMYIKSDMLGKRGVPSSLKDLLHEENLTKELLEEIATNVQEKQWKLDFEERCYERYLDYWLKNHDYETLLTSLSKNYSPAPFGEFLENEYQDADFMIEILDEQSFRDWMKETSFAIETVSDFPQWAIHYLEYGDESGDFTEEDKKLADEWQEKNNFAHWDNTPSETHFSNSPEFGLPCDVVPVTFVTKELNRILEKLEEKENEKFKDYEKDYPNISKLGKQYILDNRSDTKEKTLGNALLESAFDRNISVVKEMLNLKANPLFQDYETGNNFIHELIDGGHGEKLEEVISLISNEELKSVLAQKNLYNNETPKELAQRRFDEMKSVGLTIDSFKIAIETIEKFEKENSVDKGTNLLNDIIHNGIETLKENNYNYDGQIDGEVFAGENERIDFNREKFDNAQRIQIAANLVNYLQSEGFDQQYINEKLGINDEEQEFFTNYPNNIENKIDFSDDFINSKTLDELIELSNSKEIEQTKLFDENENLKWHSIDYTTKSWLEIGDLYIEKNDSPYQLSIGQSFSDLEAEYGNNIPQNKIKTFESEKELDDFVIQEFNLKKNSKMKLDDILNQMEFMLEEKNDKFQVFDYQKNEYLENGEDENGNTNYDFENAEEIIYRMEIFFDDYFFSEIKKTLTDLNLLKSESWEYIYKTAIENKEKFNFEDFKGDLEVLDCLLHPENLEDYLPKTKNTQKLIQERKDYLSNLSNFEKTDENLIIANDLALLLREQDKENNNFGSLRPTGEQILDMLEDGWGIDEAVTGYMQGTSDDLPNDTIVIMKIDSGNLFNSDLDAAKQAEKDGIKLISEIELENSYPLNAYRFIDTEKNREILKENGYLKNFEDLENVSTFENDREKMIDFFALEKESFLNFYSYLTEEEYEATKNLINKQYHIEENVTKLSLESIFKSKLTEDLIKDGSDTVILSSGDRIERDASRTYFDLYSGSDDAHLLANGDFLTKIAEINGITYFQIGVNVISLDSKEVESGLEPTKQIEKLTEELVDSFNTLDFKPELWKSLIEKGADLKQALFPASSDAYLGDNLRWLIENISEEKWNEIKDDRKFCEEVFENAKNSIMNDKEFSVNPMLELAEKIEMLPEAVSYCKQLEKEYGDEYEQAKNLKTSYGKYEELEISTLSVYQKALLDRFKSFVTDTSKTVSNEHFLVQRESELFRENDELNDEDKFYSQPLVVDELKETISNLIEGKTYKIEPNRFNVEILKGIEKYLKEDCMQMDNFLTDRPIPREEFNDKSKSDEENEFDFVAQPLNLDILHDIFSDVRESLEKKIKEPKKFFIITENLTRRETLGNDYYLVDNKEEAEKLISSFKEEIEEEWEEFRSRNTFYSPELGEHIDENALQPSRPEYTSYNIYEVDFDDLRAKKLIEENRFSIEDKELLENITENSFDFEKLADELIQNGLENSTSSNYQISFEEIAKIAGKDEKWVSENLENIRNALSSHNDNELLDYPYDTQNEDNEKIIDLNYCSLDENEMNLFRKENGRWVRKTETEIALYYDIVEKLSEDFYDYTLSEITDVKIYNPEDYGFEKDDKLHVLVEFEGKSREDDLFNILHDEENPFSYLGKEVDCNPINIEKSGTIEQYLGNLKNNFQKEKINENIRSEILEVTKDRLEYTFDWREFEANDGFEKLKNLPIPEKDDVEILYNAPIYYGDKADFKCTCILRNLASQNEPDNLVFDLELNNNFASIDYDEVQNMSFGNFKKIVESEILETEVSNIRGITKYIQENGLIFNDSNFVGFNSLNMKKFANHIHRGDNFYTDYQVSLTSEISKALNLPTQSNEENILTMSFKENEDGTFEKSNYIIQTRSLETGEWKTRNRNGEYDIDSPINHEFAKLIEPLIEKECLNELQKEIEFDKNFSKLKFYENDPKEFDRDFIVETDTVNKETWNSLGLPKLSDNEDSAYIQILNNFNNETGRYELHYEFTTYNEEFDDHIRENQKLEPMNDRLKTFLDKKTSEVIHERLKEDFIADVILGEKVVQKLDFQNLDLRNPDSLEINKKIDLKVLNQKVFGYVESYFDNSFETENQKLEYHDYNPIKTKEDLNVILKYAQNFGDNSINFGYAEWENEGHDQLYISKKDDLQGWKAARCVEIWEMAEKNAEKLLEGHNEDYETMARLFPSNEFIQNLYKSQNVTYDFKNLSETVQTKLIENLWQKGDLELKESWISELKNRGEETAPLQKVDIEWAKNYLKDWTIEKSDLDELTFSQSEINRILKSNIKKSIQNVIGDFEEGKDEKNQVNISATFDTNRLNPGKVYNGENVYFSIPLKYCKEEKIIDKVCEEYEKLFGYKPKYWSGGQRTSPDPEDYMRFYTGATANLGFDDDFKEHLFEVNPIIEKQKEELTFVNSQLDEIFNIKKIASNQFEYSYKVEGKLSDSDTIEFKQDLPILEAANIIAFRELSGLNLSNFEISENERSNELYMVCVNMEGREERNYIYTGEQLKERDAASYEAASKNPSDWNYGKSYASNITSSVKKVENLDELKEFLNGNYSTSAHEEEVATDIEFYINDEGKPCREWNYSFDFGDYMADKYNYDNSQSFEDYLNDVKKVIDSYNDKELSDLYSKRREIAESYDDYSRTKEIFEEIQKEKLHSLDYKNEEDVLRFQNWFNQIVSENLQIKSYENAKLLLSYATDFNDGDYKYAINENNEIYFNTEADSAGWEKTTLDNFVSSAINNSYSLIEDGYASPEEKDFIQDFDEEWTSQQQLINNSLGKIVDSTKEFYEFFKDVGSPDYLKSRFEDARRENEENGIDNDDDTVLPIAIENMIDSEIPIKDLNLIQDITHDILNGKYKDFEDVRENYKENYKEFYPELRENDLDSLYTPLSKEALMKFINIEEIDSFTEEMAEHCLGIFENQNIPLVTDELGNVYQREISKDLATGTDEDLTLLSPSGVIDFYRNEIERDFEQSAEIESEKPQVLKILENLEDKLVKIEENQKQIDKLQFDWSDFTKQDFDDLKERLQNPEEMFDDIFGSVKIGDISIDIVNNYGNDVENGYLDDDFYIFGEEGYDVNSATGLPYNEVDGKGISFATILNSDYETFQKIMEKEWSETISKSEYLLTEAQRPLLKEWGSEEAFELYEQKRREEGIEDTISISQKNALSDISVDSMDEILVLDDENVNFDVYLTDEFWRRTGYFKSETEMKSVLNDENNNLYQTVTINPDTKDVYLNIDGYKNRVQKLKLKGDGVDYLINALEQRCLSTDNKSIKMIRDELFSEINYKVAKNVLLAVADHGYPDAFVAQRELGLTDSQMKDLLENTSKTHKEIWDKQEIDILETIGEKLVNRYLEDNGFDNEASNPNYFKDYEPCKNTLSDLILTFEDKPMTNQEKIWDRFIQNILNERINDPKISFKQAYTNVLTKVISTGLDSDYKELSEIFKKIYNGNPNSIFEKIDKDVSQKLKNKKLDMTFLKENSVIETKSDSKTRIASISQKLHSSNQNREL